MSDPIVLITGRSSRKIFQNDNPDVYHIVLSKIDRGECPLDGSQLRRNKHGEEECPSCGIEWGELGDDFDAINEEILRALSAMSLDYLTYTGLYHSYKQTREGIMK